MLLGGNRCVVGESNMSYKMMAVHSKLGDDFGSLLAQFSGGDKKQSPDASGDFHTLCENKYVRITVFSDIERQKEVPIARIVSIKVSTYLLFGQNFLDHRHGISGSLTGSGAGLCEYILA